jgi:hypothetical protein
MSKREDAPALAAPSPSNTRPLLVPSKSTVVSCPTKRAPVQQAATATRTAMQILIRILSSRERCILFSYALRISASSLANTDFFLAFFVA